jgi:exosome complex component CSL4
MDIHTYQLSTAENELGVVISHSDSGTPRCLTFSKILIPKISSGVPMVPISWTEMQCPVTYTKKLRKVAKVIPENIDMSVEQTEDQPAA